jgi:Lactate racemase N-terminal domain
MTDLPRIIHVRQKFTPTPPVDVRATFNKEFAKLRHRFLPGQRIAVGVGSRGITNLAAIVAAVLDQIRLTGAEPFIIPAMGSHGGATPQGQRELLDGYGVTEETMGVPIRDSLEVRQVGVTSDGVPVYCSTEALDADGIFLVNRVKPHTDFFGTLGSGLLKMCVIGLGKRTGATAMHLAATQFGYERVIRGMAAILIENTPVIGGLAIIENQFHETARLVAVPRESMASTENQLLDEAKALMPTLPFDEIDLLIIDAIGKNVSGAGMDPNVINRSIHGYNSLPQRDDRPAPFIRRIFVRGLTPQTHGNAIGIGMADATTKRLASEMDTRVTHINALTALTPQSAKLPIVFENDRDAIAAMLASLPLTSARLARVIRIADTLSLADMEISESLWTDAKRSANLDSIGGLREIEFNADGNLA